MKKREKSEKFLLDFHSKHKNVYGEFVQTAPLLDKEEINGLVDVLSYHKYAHIVYYTTHSTSLDSPRNLACLSSITSTHLQCTPAHPPRSRNFFWLFSFSIFLALLFVWTGSTWHCWKFFWLFSTTLALLCVLTGPTWHWSGCYAPVWESNRSKKRDQKRKRYTLPHTYTLIHIHTFVHHKIWN